ncbi:MAG: hypothetical protein FJX25_02100 [Alphaproteobacteria bacterium]|nr:hypothetical protein [Alphaproteobacteria bacterium]
MAKLKRPMPPAEQVEGINAWFSPAPDLAAWAVGSFIANGEQLRNPDHEHLQNAHIGFLWTNVQNARKDRLVIGTAEPGAPQGAMGKWSRAHAVLQVTEWFGMVPQFIVTIDATCWLRASDAEACALVEHELYHCAQDRDDVLPHVTLLLLASLQMLPAHPV